MKIWFDMDGTIANLYGVENWLNMLIEENPAPYLDAKPLLNLSYLARLLNGLQATGCKIGIITWLSKSSSENFASAVSAAKMRWLTCHLPSVQWDYINIVPYGTNKRAICGDGILFDDEENNREQWGEGAYEPSQIFQVLKIVRNKS